MNRENILSAVRLIDSHTHLHFADFDQDREVILKQFETDKQAAISIGTDLATSKKEVQIAQESARVFSIVGIHPADSKDSFAEQSDEFIELVKKECVVGVGETGFDYFRLEPADEKADKARQRDNFEAQITLALEYDLPLMLHCRNSSRSSTDAVTDILEVLESYARVNGEKLRGQAHFFSETPLLAKRYLDINFSLSFTGVITFTDSYDESVRYVPSERLLIETDAPFVAPKPYRGKRNEPSYVIEVAKRLAELRGEDLSQILKITTQNAIDLYRLPLTLEV